MNKYSKYFIYTIESPYCSPMREAGFSLIIEGDEAKSSSFYKLMVEMRFELANVQWILHACVILTTLVWSLICHNVHTFTKACINLFSVTFVFHYLLIKFSNVQPDSKNLWSEIGMSIVYLLNKS